MSNWEEGNYNDDAHSWVSSALAALPMTAFQQVTTKVPPAFNGLTSWFTFEELIDHWTDITELCGKIRPGFTQSFRRRCSSLHTTLGP